MAEESPADAAPARLMQFVTEYQLDEAKKARGERVDDGTAQVDRPLFEILKENKDKRDAEFNERFKHRPPKTLDEDETELLDNLEMSRREYERQMADEEAQQLRSFQEAVAARSSVVYQLKETPSAIKAEEPQRIGKKCQVARPLGSMLVTVKRSAKKAKVEISGGKSSTAENCPNGDGDELHVANTGAAVSLVSYSDESEDDSLDA